MENDVAGFLGELMKKSKDETTIEFLQTGLIDRIIAATVLEGAMTRRTPTQGDPLGADVDGDPCEETWNYFSVIGMLMYLAANSQPDIAFAVHQCARYSHAPRRSHEIAVIHIDRYLVGTRTRGMMISRLKGASLEDDLTLDCYADASFAGLWGYENDQDPSSVKSRTGFVITLGGTPVLWTSKMHNPAQDSSTTYL